MRSFSQPLNIMDAQAANGAGTTIFVRDFKTVSVSFDSSASGSFITKFQGSIAADPPTFSSAQSPSNQWDYVQIVDLENGVSIDGDTGITLSGTDDNRQFEINTNGLTWLTAIISSYSAGNLTINAVGYND